MAKLTKEMLRNLIMEALDEELTSEGFLDWVGGQPRTTGTKSPLTPGKAAPRMGAIGAAAGEEGYADSAPADDRDAILALWDKVAGLEASVKDLVQDTTPTVMSPASGGGEEDVPVPATVKTAATKFAEEPTARVAESRRRVKRRH